MTNVNSGLDVLSPPAATCRRALYHVSRRSLAQVVQLREDLLGGREGGRRILLAEPDDPLFVHDDNRPVGGAPLLVPQAVGFDHLPRGITVGKQREGDVPQTGSPHLVGELAVRAYAQNLGALLFEPGVGPAQGDGLVASSTCEIEHMEGEDHVLLALELAHGNPVPGVGG